MTTISTEQRARHFLEYGQCPFYESPYVTFFFTGVNRQDRSKQFVIILTGEIDEPPCSSAEEIAGPANIVSMVSEVSIRVPADCEGILLTIEDYEHLREKGICK